MDTDDLGTACAPWQSTHAGASAIGFPPKVRTWRLFAYAAAVSEWQPEQSTRLSRAVWGTPLTSAWQSVQETSACTDCL